MSMAMIPVGKVEGQPVLYEVGEYVDDFGVKRTTFEFVKRRHDGTRVRIPMMPPIKVKTYSRDSYLGDDTVEISPGDARRLFRDNYQTIVKA